MRKSAGWWVGAAFLCWWTGSSSALAVTLSDDASAAYTALANARLTQAKSEVERIRVLVNQGALPNSWLQDAELKLADAQDEETLSQLFYGKPRVQDITDDDAKAMIDAASRRVDREAAVVAHQQELVNQGVMARAEIDTVQRELESRRRILSLAENRVKLMQELREMATAEARLQSQNPSGALRNVMIRYDGNGIFHIAELPSISQAFERQFHRPLPVSALGQTALHQSLGLDHRDRVDIALNPDGVEGVWFRQYLEQLHIPFLAFRSAIAGAATAPHIHLGTGSNRLKLAQTLKSGG